MRRMSIAVAVVVGLGLACTGPAESPTTGPGMGGPSASPDPAPAPVPAPPPERRRGKRKAGGGGREGKVRNPSAVELETWGYGDPRDYACTSCDRAKCDPSVRVSSGDGQARRMLDGDADTAWCPSGAVGEKITLSLPAGCNVYGFSILGGDFATSASLRGSARIAELDVTLDGKRYVGYLDDPAEASFERAVDAPAYFEVEAQPTTREWVFEVADVYGSGSACVSELRPYLFPALEQ
ncbi:MAG: hypothetical protein ABMA64_38905 [Myxococcota bacterium]